MMLEHKQTVIRTNALDFSLQRGSDLARDSVRDDRDPLLRFQSETNIDRVARAGDQFQINRVELSAIGHTENVQNYAEFERKQISWFSCRVQDLSGPNRLRLCSQYTRRSMFGRNDYVATDTRLYGHLTGSIILSPCHRTFKM